MIYLFIHGTLKAQLNYLQLITFWSNFFNRSNTFIRNYRESNLTTFGGTEDCS